MYGGDKVIEQVLHFVSNARKKIDACVDHTRPLLATKIQPLKKSLVNAKERGICLSMSRKSLMIMSHAVMN